MAITHKQAMMVHYPDGTSNSTLAPQTSACPLFVVLQQLHPVKGSQDVHTLLVKKESSPVEKSNTSSSTLFNKMSLNKMSLESVVASDTSSQECNLPAETTCNGMTVTLDNNNMWNEFFRCKTEMILTKQGRRMFPYCRFRVSGLEPFQRYILVMDMHPVDKYRYKWSDRRWEANGKAEPHNPSSFVHPDSPATGFDWMQNPVSFYKLKLTNNYSDKEAKISLNSMHRYLPRLHIIPADKVVDLVQLNEPDVTTFTFLQTEFFAVTAYQNLSITQLKIDYNPFAKGFREDANNSRSGKPKNGPFSEKLESEVRSSQNITLNNLKSLFAKRNTVEKAPANGDNKTVHCNSPINSEPEKNLSNRKRPWTEGLSELIKNTHVKVQRISSVKDPDVNDQQNNTCLETGTLDCKPENLSVGAFAKEKSNPDTNIINRADVSIEEESVALLEFTDSSMINTTNYSEQTTCSTPINEIGSTTLTNVHNIGSTTLTLNEIGSTTVPAENDIMENSQSANCGEKVKKKRAEPVPLPLLALFLQQLKSKTKPAKSVSQSETHCLSSLSNESCDTTSVADSKITLPLTLDALEDTAPSSASEAVRATTPDASLNEPEYCNLPTYASSPVSLNASTAILTGQSPETVAQPQLSDVSMFSLQIPSSPDESPLSSPPSSPDPFPPSMFSDRPVPRRKVLNPFPSCLSLARQSPLVVLPDPLPGSFLGRSRDDQDFSIPAIYSIRCEGTSPVSPLDFSKESEQFSQTTAKISSTHSKVEHLKLTKDTVAAPALEMSKNTVIMEPVICLKEPFQDITSTQPDMNEKEEKDRDVIEESLHFTSKELSAVSDCGMDMVCPVISHDSAISKKTNPSKRIKSEVKHNICGKSQRSQGPDAIDDPIQLQCVLLTEERIPVVKSVSSEVTFDSDIPTTINRPLNNAAGKRNRLKHRQVAKTKISEDSKLTEDPTSLPLQPSLEDVDGQLFASFESKKALQIHLGAQDGEGVLKPTTGNTDEESIPDNKRININALEKHLLHDLNIMRHRQVIHPVLQAVGLKLNLLDHSLPIDLQYLGVCLPIPSPAILPDESSRSSSSQFSYVSRTGKTTDLTKIKGWRDKFASPNSSSIPADAGQKNLSAFCSDMLDEYLESECKFIDERVTSFSQAVPVSPIAYQMPTKSTSYVRTLDSILKKQTPLATADTSKSSTATESTTMKLKSKKVVMSEKKKKKSAKTAATNKDVTSIKEKSSKKTAKPVTKSASPESSAGYNVTQNKESDKIKTKKRPKTSQASVQLFEKSAEGKVSPTAPMAQNSSSNHGSSTTGGRRLTLNKTLVKLMDVEDGAVWEGKHRTYITEERAAIALSCLITVEGPMEKTSSTIIKRRAPPCLKDFCRLGCICASLSHQRRQHHCCKPQCMLGCNCLRHKVLLKSPATNVSNDVPLNPNSSKEKQKKLKKCKKQMSYVLFEPEAAPEPATRVKKLWDQNCDSDVDRVFIPSMSTLLGHPALSAEQQQKVDRIPHPSHRRIKEDMKIRKNKESSSDCARVRPFCWPSSQADMKDNAPTLSSHHLQQEIEELGAPTQSGPSKRLEIVSKCRWATKGNMKNILHTLCEHMTQDRLDHPVWIGKFQIKLLSKTLSTEAKEGPTLTYRVAICQPKLEREKQVMHDGSKQLKAQLIKAIRNSKVKGLPLLSMVTPAGLLQAKTKSPGSSGHIIVNGKPYPQAKLELGKMGALHPANRLAAYITGRACPTNKPATTVLNSATTSPAPSATTSSGVPTSSVTSILSSILASVVPKGSKSSLGTDTVINSQNQILPGSSSKLITPSSAMTVATGVSNYSIIAPKPNLVFQPSPLSITKVVKILIPKPGSAKPKETTTVCSTEPPGALPSAGVRLMQPVDLAKQPVPGQKIVAFKAAKGNFLCRDSSGKLIHLMPLSQLKALKRMSQQPFVIQLPTSNTVTLINPQNDNPASTTVPSPTPSSTVPLQMLTSIHRSANVNVTSTIATKPITSLSGSKCLLINSEPGMIKIHPKFLSNSNTSTLRIVPQNDDTTQAVKDFKIIHSSALDQSSLDVYPDQGFIQLAPQSCITPKSQNIQNSDHSLQTSLVSSEEQDVKASQCSKSTNELFLTNLVYTNESKTTTSPEKSAEMPDVSSAYYTLKQGPLEIVPIKQEQETSVKDAVEDVEMKSESSELTEDSDLYDETAELSVDGDLQHTITGSSSEKRNLDGESSSDDDELVDIETIKERFTTTLGMKQQVIHQEDSSSEESENEESGIVTLKRQKVTSERKRRIALKNSFDRLMQTLHVENPKVSKIKLLRLALKEIESLNEQRSDLQKTQNNLQEERSYFLDKASRLSGKSEESIHEKLNELVSKEKSVVVMDSNHASLPNSNPMGQNFTQDLNISTQNSEQSQQIRRDDSLGSTQSVSVTNSSLQPQNECSEAKAVGSHCERIRPNILSRRMSKTQLSEPVLAPPVIPLGITSNPMILSNQIVLIQNPLQPINSQPITSGVAAVSLSVPYFANPIRVENPQLEPTDTTIPVKNLILPNIDKVVSLVASKDPVSPSSAVLQNTDIPVREQTQATSNPASVQAQRHASLIGANMDQLSSIVVSKNIEQSAKVSTVDALTKPKGSNSPSIDQENESLMSLLDELVFLNQQMNNDASKPEEEPSEVKDPLTNQLTEKDVNLDECSLSPLLLKLNEDLASTSKDKETSNILSKVPESVTFGSDFLCSGDGNLPTFNAKPNPSPPPLLQMKVSRTTSVDSIEKQTNLSWRPMPKLAPLGLKTQETGQPKSTCHKTP